MANSDSNTEYVNPGPMYWGSDSDSETSSQSLEQDDLNNENVAPMRLSPPISPLASPSLSPYSSSPLLPLHRRPFSTPVIKTSSPFPQSDEDSESDSDRDITQDETDILVQRLNRLALRLSRQRHTKGQNINTLNTKVAELEDILNTPGGLSRPGTRRGNFRRPSPGEDYDGESSWEGNYLDSARPSNMSSISSSTRTSPGAKAAVNKEDSAGTKARASKLTVTEAEQVIAEAKVLHENLEAVMANLRDRQEETEHIHSLHITRLERAAQRIITLEEQLSLLEREQRMGDTEMLNLHIQLKAIEVQCLSYVPKDADQELSESINTWKMEWSALKERRAKNRALFPGTPRTPKTPATPMRVRRTPPSG
ncbi:hypothetical protein GGS20DRAFT_531849 [Poronia punctata]|nr:hypothetical protein GGS20DRAFT_531849 [Poronia punctata]